MERDREATRTKIIDAVERLAVRDGFESCGVNAISKEAGVDKVLIYRYFGGLDGLLSATIAERAAWPATIEPTTATPSSAGSGLAATLIEIARDIRARPLAQHAVAWEATGHADHDTTKPITDGREAALSALGSALRDAHAIPPRLDLEAVGALVTAGITTLATRAAFDVPYFGLDLGQDKDWRRVEKAAATILRALLDSSDA
ncbi:MAG TPA: helix-turn-helix domain-containing protein [Gemmatimonadaceae bacterium]|nr:helix-turn-helix domain-containing protein [Gemmatimonadaceae bacterium]